MSNLKNGNEIFIVHGHDNHLKVEVARTLEKLKLEPIILHEQSNNGKTIIEKFEKFSDVSFAVILLTADDLGNSKNNIDKPNKRARQNVIFELGYFIGKLGRENVMTLKEEGVEVPNDISGVVYTPYDQQGNWKIELAKELKSTGFDIDINNLF
ncbi:nucleotide-binding protein [Chryseobacterium candidae]|uniref:Nucleotide-binding protein n=2 Tax=Chryseobacterium candidae TaxID=1978493 RepID=A0ABY2R1V6_9FLAO|nr:nucleotide-binding protein [Chryseobacterium candidae]